MDWWLLALFLAVFGLPAVVGVTFLLLALFDPSEDQ